MRHPQVRVRACFATGGADDTYQDMKPFEGPLVPVLEDLYSFILRNTLRYHTLARAIETPDEPLIPRLPFVRVCQCFCPSRLQRFLRRGCRPCIFAA